MQTFIQTLICHENFISELIKKYFEHAIAFLMTIFVKMFIQLHFKEYFQQIFRTFQIFIMIFE
jgi:hypothetical protein